MASDFMREPPRDDSDDDDGVFFRLPATLLLKLRAPQPKVRGRAIVTSFFQKFHDALSKLHEHSLPIRNPRITGNLDAAVYF